MNNDPRGTYGGKTSYNEDEEGGFREVLLRILSKFWTDWRKNSGKCNLRRIEEGLRKRAFQEVEKTERRK